MAFLKKIGVSRLAMFALSAFVMGAISLSSAHASAECGDGLIDGEEACDDADVDSGDGCSSACQVEPGYECDNLTPPSVCTLLPACGDGSLDDDEGCDDGDTDSGDGCDATCLVEESFDCNDTAPGLTGDASCATGLCDTSGGAPGVCEAEDTCGNGDREAGEGCDDGDTTSGDGCNSMCQIENGSACNSSSPGLTGSNSCASAFCDSGTCACDGAADCAMGQVCDLNESPNACESTGCGNGTLETGEGCDDGDTSNNDGCNSSCKVENGSECNQTAPGSTGDDSCASGVCDTTEGGGGECEPANMCGNNKLEADEGCDDGNTSNSDGCRANCLIENTFACNSTAPGDTGDNSCFSGICDTTETPDTCEAANVCGNHVIEGVEGCDDGNTTATDGCNASCKIENGQACTTSGQCASMVCNSVSHVCQASNVCGNSVTESGEGCDDGNTMNNDGCNSMCLKENGQTCSSSNVCASGICDTTENPDVCEAANTCGNHTVESGEGCDDGNTTNSDGCNSMCLKENNQTCSTSNQCASGVCDATESPDRCEAANTCGNGSIDTGEGCDDGRAMAGDGCNASCLIETGSACEDDAECATGICSTVCEASDVCGNGVVDSGEGCDDDNTTSDDGCSSNCFIEVGEGCEDSDQCVSGAVCDTEDSDACEPENLCGNGVIEGAEECDDGDTNSNDGCSSLCTADESISVSKGCSFTASRTNQTMFAYWMALLTAIAFARRRRRASHRY